MAKLRDRPTGDLLVLMVAATICGGVVFSGISVLLIELFHPETDTTPIARQIADVVNTLIGLLAGFLAGRTDVAQHHKKPPEEKL